jgi:hypothetical protein
MDYSQAEVIPDSIPPNVIIAEATTRGICDFDYKEGILSPKETNKCVYVDQDHEYAVPYGMALHIELPSEIVSIGGYWTGEAPQFSVLSSDLPYVFHPETHTYAWGEKISVLEDHSQAKVNPEPYIIIILPADPSWMNTWITVEASVVMRYPKPTLNSSGFLGFENAEQTLVQQMRLFVLPYEEYHKWEQYNSDRDNLTPGYFVLICGIPLSMAWIFGLLRKKAPKQIF